MLARTSLQPLDNRGHIDMDNGHDVRCWSRHLGLSHQELQRIVEKVGNSAAAVRKEISVTGKIQK
jgi:hypothetical protein